MYNRGSLTRTLFSTWIVLAIGVLFLAGCSPAVFAENNLSTATEKEGSSVQLGNEVVVPKGTINQGDAVAIFDDVIVDGEVRGTAVSIGGDVRVNGKVSGDVVSVGGRVVLSETAEVTGEVTVVGAGLDRAPGARITGTINNIGVGDFLRRPHINVGQRHFFNAANPIGYLFYLIGLFALAMLTISLFPNHVASVADYMEKDWGRSAMVGILTLLLIGPVSILVAVTIIGIPLVALLWVGFFLAKMLGYVAFVTLLGTRITRNSATQNHITQLGLGVLVLGLIRYVPVIGALASFAVTLVTLGAVVDSRFGTNKPWLPPRKTA